MDGVQMWSVALENTMFTYFEIEPDRFFDIHSHESEQITMVLEGELHFKLQEKIICVKKGEVIAIPSWTPHAAYTKKQAAKAVDAWSPVMKKYQRKNNNPFGTERRLARCPGMKP
jgi:quercetin dioxygenase-like cupin family protein